MVSDDGLVTQAVRVCAVSDERMRRLLKGSGLEEAPFFSGHEVHGLLYDRLHLYNPATGRYSIANVFSSDDVPVVLPFGNNAKSAFTSPFTVYGDAFIDELPLEAEAVNAQGILLLISNTQYHTLFPVRELGDTRYIGLKAANSEAVYDALRALIAEQKGPISEYGFIWNAEEEFRRDRGLRLVVNVFSYGFIVLITLISMVNVFNTITTNIQLRRRDFAMLQSVGMTQKGILRMLNYECVIYGLRALAIGLPLAILVSFALYYAFISGVELAFILPWKSILIAAAGVFAIVFSAMLYSMRKIRRENMIDALKQENL